MGKEDQIIMVVDRHKLFGTPRLEDCPQGFLSRDFYDFTPEINLYFEWKKRGNPKINDQISAESNPAYKQLIAYSVVVNPVLNKVFAYKRAINESYHESRLAGNWSWGVGGHVEKVDVRDSEQAYDIIIRSRDRELSEEIEIRSVKSPVIKLLGYINDDSNDVGRVHLGLLYIVETNAEEIIPDDKEIAEGGYKNLEELEKICMQAKIDRSVMVDSWSEFALSSIRDFFR
ncbi:MAG: hypothetical protein AABW90_03730 [Nanoarchaeota archaeon]